MQEQQNGVVQDFIRENESAELEKLSTKVSKMRKIFLFFLTLFVISIICVVVIPSVQEGTEKPIEYSQFNPGGKSGKDVCIEVSRLVPVIEETSSSGSKFHYMAYNSADSDYEYGLIKISEKLYNTEEIQALIKYSRTELARATNLPVPSPITFYGETVEVSENLESWLSIERLNSRFPNIDPGEVYLAGGLEPGSYTELPALAQIASLLAPFLGIITIVVRVKYTKAIKRRKQLWADLKNIELA